MKSNYCSLESFSSVEEFLKKTFSFSGQKIKKNFEKKFLSRKLVARDEVYIPLNLLNEKDVFPVYLGEILPEIVFEDELIVAINKPIRCHNHPLSYEEGDNVMSYFRSIDRADLLMVNCDSYDRGLLYRLDYETSGLLLYAKSEALYQEARTNFSKLMKEKIYECVVSGDFIHEGVHTHFLKSFGENSHKMICVSEAHGEKAVLSVAKVSYDKTKNLSFLRVSLQTGLRHQIRVQLKELGFPLLGDGLYGGDSYPRLCLNAYSYQLTYQGKLYSYCLNSSLFEGLG